MMDTVFGSSPRTPFFPCRRFFNALLAASHLVTHCTLSQLIQMHEGDLFCQLVQMLRFYARFEIDDVTGTQLTQGQVRSYRSLYINLSWKCILQVIREKGEELIEETWQVDNYWEFCARVTVSGRFQMTDRHYSHVVSLQKAAFKFFRSVFNFLCSISLSFY